MRLCMRRRAADDLAILESWRHHCSCGAGLVRRITELDAESGARLRYIYGQCKTAPVRRQNTTGPHTDWAGSGAACLLNRNPSLK